MQHRNGVVKAMEGISQLIRVRSDQQRPVLARRLLHLTAETLDDGGLIIGRELLLTLQLNVFDAAIDFQYA